jgi:hypothetical protein
VPDNTSPTCSTEHRAAPTEGPTCSDQRQPRFVSRTPDREAADPDELEPALLHDAGLVGGLEPLQYHGDLQVIHATDFTRQADNR